MNIYADALTKHLASRRQADFADAVGIGQGTISRYVKGSRLPPREVAEKIAEASDGAVPLTLWRIVAAERAGLAA